VRRFRALAATAICGLVLAVAAQAPAAVARKPVYPGAKPITLKTPTSDVGPHPILRWKATVGVATYEVVVQTPKGTPYWAGRTTETQLRFGGGPLDAPKKTEGAALTRNEVWFVLGVDDAGVVVAASSKRPISP
jgi:hypothetical protein